MVGWLESCKILPLGPFHKKLTVWSVSSSIEHVKISALPAVIEDGDVMVLLTMWEFMHNSIAESTNN